MPVGYLFATTVVSPDPVEAEPAATTTPPVGEAETDEPASSVVSPPDIIGEPRDPGTWNWWDLRGGECLGTVPETLSDAVTVVSCETSFPAVYLNPTVLSEDPGEAFPGEDDLLAHSREHCLSMEPAAFGALWDLDDLVVQPLAPLSESLWQEGPRVMGCLVSRENGDLLESDPTLEKGSS